MKATPTHITGIRTVSIPVNDQAAAVHFYTEEQTVHLVPGPVPSREVA